MAIKKTKKYPSGRKNKIITRDRHALYEASVQAVDHDADILIDIYRKIVRKNPYSLREDFCGTHMLCCEWISRGPKYKAIGIDHCKNTILYGKKKHQSKLSAEEKKRLRIYCKDVASITEKTDIIAACNFSYLTFQKRKTMLSYFKHCYKSLKKDGVLMLDLFGGTDTEVILKEKTPIVNDSIKTFTYIWDLSYFNPVDRRATFHIHFQYPNNGPYLKKAFSYEWRMWTIPELKDIMLEAGFADVNVFWEKEDKDGEGSGEFYLTTEEENDPTWIAYLAASKQKSKIGKRK